MNHINLSGTSRNSIGSIADKNISRVVGFGSSQIVNDREEVILDFEVENEKEDLCVSIAEAEQKISFDPNTKYFLKINAPLWNATWERNSLGEFVCTESGSGFA